MAVAAVSPAVALPAAPRQPPAPSFEHRGAVAALQRSVSRALGLLARHEGTRQRRLAVRAFADLGDIDLPDLDTPPPAARDAELLAPIGPLYMAYELEQAGLLRTAELVAGLFASGAIQQPLGETEARINDFWRLRQQRLSEAERLQLLGQIFDPQAFYPHMQRLCVAIAALADNIDAGDLREAVGLEQAALALAELLASRSGGMLAYAASDILAAVNTALAFMNDRALQLAFGARDLWALVATAGTAQETDAGKVRLHVELAREGASVLVWLAGTAARPAAAQASGRRRASGGAGGSLDPAGPLPIKLIGAALRWQMAWQSGLPSK